MPEHASSTAPTAHVIGGGGIGVALGWALARAGWAVTLVEVNPAKVAAGRREGVWVDGVPERRIAVADFADWTPPDGALLLLCTKTYDNAAVLARIPERRWLLPVQNGYDPLLEVSNHPCEGIASFVSQGEPVRLATRLTRPGDLYLGGRRALTAPERQVLETLAAALRRGGLKRVRVVETIAPYKAAKLMYNAAISPLAAAAGVDNGSLLSDPLAQRLFFALLRENYAILHTSGVPLARIGPFSPKVVDRILRWPGLARMLAHFFRPGLRGTYCSMAKDIRTGRTEMAAYNGYLRGLARDGACPLNDGVLKMMNTMQSESLLPGRARLAELGRAVGLGGMP